MSAEAKALLDELMGRSRNLDPSQQPVDISWNSDDVCKHFLCGFCPHELFTNTRADLGPCNKIHDDLFKKEYEKSSKYERCGYEEDFMRFLQSLITDVEKRIRRGHQRLALNSQQSTLSLNGGISTQQEDKVKLLTEKINELVEQAEDLGCHGKVEEAQGVMKLVDQLKEERQDLEKQPAQEESPMIKQMEVCDVCGAFLIVGDAPQRQDEHLMGKQHAGYAQVRAEIDRRKKKVRDEIEAREATQAKLKLERDEREKERQRERDERRKKERDREKERERDRGKRRRSGSRSRDRRRSHSRDRKRSSSRDRKKRRSTSRDRRRGQRSRDRDRERERDRSRRSRSGSKSHRSSRSSRRSSSRDRRSSHRRSRDRSSRDRHRSRSKDRKRKSSHEKDKDRDSKHSSKSEKEDIRVEKNAKDEKCTPEIKNCENGGIEEEQADQEKNETRDETERGQRGDCLQHKDTDSSIPMQIDETGDSVNGNDKDFEEEASNLHGPPLSEGDTKIDE
ncbi:LUC7-like protein 3 [Elysia marginata]|uniref:LUC7-like protein 3 n=1 Tax=Elysia marginata TaxID=1093978 RepID=A0AAV4JBW0_9GAST|nr:LUC7-like protein 3 [Elysia marginata]